MRQLRAFLRFFLATLLALAANLAPAANSETSPLVIGQVVDLSGPNADFGRDYSFGAKLYFDYANGSGGINGRRIVYRSRDSAGSAAQGLGAAQGLLREGAGLLFGVNGDDVLRAISGDPAIRAGNVAIFGAVSGNTRLDPKDGIIYLRAGTAQEIAATVANLAPMGIRSIALASAGDFTREANAALDEAARRHGVRVTARLRFDIAGDGPERAAQAVAREHPQAVIVAADTVAVALFFKRYRSLDQGAFLCTTSQVNVRTLISIMGLQGAHGMIVSQVVPDPGSISELTREHKKLMERLADEPASHATLEGFIAAKALVRTLRRNGETGRNGLLQNLQRAGRIDLGGYDLDFTRSMRGSNFVELTVVGRNGQLLR